MQEANRKIGYNMDVENTKEVDEFVSLPEQNDCIGMLQQDYIRRDDETLYPSPEKVLIFSQFLEHIHVIEQQVAAIFLRLGLIFACFSSCLLHFFPLQLTVAGIKFSGMYSPMHSSNKVLILSIYCISYFL